MRSNTGTTGTAPYVKKKKHLPKHGDEGVCAKKKRELKPRDFVNTEAEGDAPARPSKDKGKRKANTPAEPKGSEKGESLASKASKLEPGLALYYCLFSSHVYKVCINHGTECLWPLVCGACVVAKSHCKVEGMSVRDGISSYYYSA